MQAKNKTTTGPLLLRIALILLCMTLFSTSMLSGLYAKYTAKNDGNDDARVALFKVEAGWSENVTVNASVGDTQGNYTFTVTNDSEVAVRYDLIVTFDQTLPAGVSLALQDYGLSLSDGNIYTFHNIASLAPGTTGTTHTLTFTMDPDAFTKSESGSSVTKTVSFTATIRCTQID